MKFKVIDKKTGEEADTYEIALHEEWANHLCYCDMEGFAITENGDLMLVDECGNSAYCDTERFKVVFEYERPHGEWEQVVEMTYKCTKCGWLKKTGLMPFCENCGADMRKEGEAE